MNNEFLMSNFGLSKSYVEGLSDKDKELYLDVSPVRKSTYVVDVRIYSIETTLKQFEEQAIESGGVFDLNPDFQRGHVWNENKQIKFIEAVLKNNAPVLVKFNCASYFQSRKEVVGMNPSDIICVDGLQRITAMRKFVAGELKVFDKYYVSDFEGTPFDIRRYTFKIEMFDFTERNALLKFYIDLNRGGVVHSDEEIERVKALIK